MQFTDNGNYLSFDIYGKKIESFSLGIIGAEETAARLETPDSSYESDEKIPGLAKTGKFFITKQKYVKFGISNEEVDAGQSFVPYFDGTEIVMDVRSPLSGLGFLHYLNNDSYAGFIRPYLKSLNYEDFIMKLEEDDPTIDVAAISAELQGSQEGPEPNDGGKK